MEPRSLRDKIDSRVQDVGNLVASLPAGELLSRAHWHAVAATQGVETDLDIRQEQISAMRLVEYLQSVIVSVPPSASAPGPISEAQWDKLVALVDSLFDSVHAYLVEQSSRQDPRQPGRGDWLKFLLSMQWLGSRGHNYMVHVFSHYEDLLRPHSDLFEEVYGVTGEELVAGLRKVHRATIDGLREMQEAFERVRDGILSGDSPITDHAADSAELLRTLVVQAGVEQDADIVTDTLTGMRLFDVGRVTGFPERLLDDLSWSPGEHEGFYGPGDMSGWPLREWPTFSRPFIRLDGRYYCFDSYLLADRFPIALRRGVLRRRPDFGNRWREIQTELTEELAMNYLQSMLPGARVQRNVHWDWDGKIWETDALIAYDDHLLVVESKSGAFSPASPALDFESHVKAASELGEGPVRQAARFINALDATGQIALFDSNARHSRIQVGTIARSDFRRVSPVAVTLSPFTEFAAQLLQLTDIGIGDGLPPAWVVSVNDLRLCADIFDNPLIFLHYLETRLAAAPLHSLWLNDELDHLGLYLGHNDYGTYAREEADGGDLGVVFSLGGRALIDAHFMPHPPWGQVDSPLRQEMPGRLQDLLDLLARSHEYGRAKVASYLLDSGGDLREQFDSQIGDELERHKVRQRPVPLSFYGPEREGITLVCWSPSTGPRRPGWASRHTEALVVLSREPERLLLEVTADAKGRLISATWCWIRLDDIDDSRRALLAPDVDRLRRRRVAAAASSGRIGRNDPCPCQSGDKYKRCCLNRFGAVGSQGVHDATRLLWIGSED